jgi:hypothetical protein
MLYMIHQNIQGTIMIHDKIQDVSKDTLNGTYQDTYKDTLMYHFTYLLM